MAMMECPNCGGQVSDKAKKCVHCGAVLIEEEKMYCTECGTELDEQAEVCPKCGCPVERAKEVETEPQKVEVTGVRITKKSRKIIVIAAVAILTIVLGIAGIAQVHKKYEAKKQAEEMAKRNKEYSANLELATYSMLSGGGNAETCCNLIKQVWYNAIYEEYDDATNKYTRKNGHFVSDFNDALQNLFEDPSFSSKVSNIKDNQDSVNSLMKELKDPPDEHKEAYEAVKELYDAYIELIRMATDPTGSLQTYSSNFSDIDSEFVKCFESTQLYFGE